MFSPTGPQLVADARQIAWPAGNSGIAALFEPQEGGDGTLGLSLVNSTSTGNSLDPIYENGETDESPPIVGVSGHLSFNSSATLTVPILGSVRTMRDYIEGSKILVPEIQDAIKFTEVDQGGVSLDRLWLDNVTTTTLSFTPNAENGSVTIDEKTLKFEPGVYSFNASFNYPQLDQLSPQEVFNEEAQNLIDDSPELSQALSFLSYTTKLTAGAWRFLTYFGRDSMISMLLMSPILSVGEDSGFEAGIMALLERINKTDGGVAHEETIGDYATWINLQDGINSTDPLYDYKMIDTDYFLPIVLQEYFIKNEVGKTRIDEVLNKTATEDPDNTGITYRRLATLNAEKILNMTAPFAAPDGQKQENLIRLHEGDAVGDWRDSPDGLGGGRIPYNVNTAIAPAGLRAIAALAEAGFFPDHSEWAERASEYATVWEDETLRFFEVEVPQDEAKSLVDDYVSSNDFPFPSNSEGVNSSVQYYGVALEGGNNQDMVKVMNTDDCFRHFLLNTTNEDQLTSFISQTADHILAPYPVGLTTDVGLLVANPAYGGDPVYSANFSNAAYHGTVVWSWQLSMMAKGLERQLERCGGDNEPAFCQDQEVHDKVLSAYNRLWDVIEDNTELLSGEVWSWRYEDDKFVPIALGALNPTESNVRQLWSLTFLAVRRNESLR